MVYLLKELQSKTEIYLLIIKITLRLIKYNIEIYNRAKILDNYIIHILIKNYKILNCD